MRIELRNVTEENKFGWLMANRHLFSFKIEGNEIFAYEKGSNNLVTSANLPKRNDSDCLEYAYVALTEEAPVKLSIPCVAKIGDVMWYCPPTNRNDVSPALFFNKNDCRQVRITAMDGASDMTICYESEDIEGKKWSGMQSLYHHSLAELLDFIEKANKFEDACEYFWYYQTEHSENRENKNRFRYLLTNTHYNINDVLDNNRVNRIVFSSNMSSYIQMLSLWTDESENIVPREEDLIANIDDSLRYGEFRLNDGRVISQRVFSKNIAWNTFKIEENK